MSKKHNTYKIRKKEAKEKKDGPKRDFYFFMIRVLTTYWINVGS